jgi:hypothetical protein
MLAAWLLLATAIGVPNAVRASPRFSMYTIGFRGRLAAATTRRTC